MRINEREMNTLPLAYIPPGTSRKEEKKKPLIERPISYILFQESMK